MKGLHNDIGHPGRERTTKLVRERFYWPGMTAEVDQWITRCERCLKRKSGVDRAPRLPIDSVFEKACAPDTHNPDMIHSIDIITFYNFCSVSGRKHTLFNGFSFVFYLSEQ